MSSSVTCLRQFRAHSRLVLALALSPEYLAGLWSCPQCGALPGRRCIGTRRERKRPHAQRMALGANARPEAERAASLADALVSERGKAAFYVGSELADLIEPLELVVKASAAPFAWLRSRAARSERRAEERKGGER